MPSYRFYNHKTKEEWDEFMGISERTSFLEDNPHIEQLVNGAPALGDSVKLGITKPDRAFRDLLGQLKKNNKDSTINDF